MRISCSTTYLGHREVFIPIGNKSKTVDDLQEFISNNKSSGRHDDGVVNSTKEDGNVGLLSEANATVDVLTSFDEAIGNGSIFFTVTNRDLETFSGLQLCAFESAARHNKDRRVVRLLKHSTLTCTTYL